MLAMLILGISYVLFGVSALLLNKYPRKESLLKKMEGKHGKIDGKKLSKFEGFHYLFVGAIFIIAGIFINSTKYILFIWAIIFIVLGLFFDIVYYQLRKKYIGIK